MEEIMYRFGNLEEKQVKVFVSWSGDLSKKIAESIKKWLPCIIQATKVFFSPEDIEKGENWDSKISKELNECKYGIICLTNENVSAPWINFEAGAIAKSLDSHVATLMININPSDIKGPLSRYQATKIEKDDFYQLICNINSQCEEPIDSEILKTTFDGLWDNMKSEIENIVSSSKKASNNSKKATIDNAEAIEEILLLLRKQNAVLSSPQQLLPPDYFEFLNEKAFRVTNTEKYDELVFEILHYLDWLINSSYENNEIANMIIELNIGELINIIGHYINNRRTNRKLVMQYREIRDKFRFPIEPSNSRIDV